VGSACATRIAKGIGGKDKETNKNDRRGLGRSRCKSLVPFVCVWKMKFCLTSLESRQQQDLWNRLERIYMENSLTNKIFLKRQLYSLRMKEGTKISDHLNVFNTLICQLSSMEVKYKDEDKEVMLLCSLPESWDHLVTSMWFITTDTIDYDIVVGDLLNEEMRRRSSQEKSTSEAMVARGRYKERGEDSRGTSRAKLEGRKGREK
jgi:hypothetical protein